MSPITIVIDTREQTPLLFADGVPTIRATLRSGDYAPLGYEELAVIERKTVADFVASVTRERERFWRELERLRAYELKAVVVEGDLMTAARGKYRSTASPKAIVASALAITTDFGVPVIWAGTPAVAAYAVEWMLRRFVTRKQLANQV